MNVCLIVPMYNEEAIAETSVRTIRSYAKALTPSPTIIVVDDGSRDATSKIVQTLIGQEGDGRLVLLSHEKNRGYGAALRTGIRFAIDGNYDYALFMDSDLTNHPKYLAAFYEKMHGGCEYIKATRYAHGGGMEGVPRKRRLFSRVGNFIAGILFRLPLTDVTNGFRAVKVEILRKLELREKGFSIIMEELCQAKRFVHSFCEVPYILTDRKAGQGETHFPYTIRTMAIYLYYAFIAFFYGRPQ